MARSFYVIHPRPGRTFAPFFVAYGRWLSTPARLVGVLKNSRGEPVALGRVVKSDRRMWAMVFEGMPDGAGYVLEVRAGGETRTVDDLRVITHTAIQVMYPTEDDLPVGTTFIAYGNTNVTTALSASLTPDGGGTVTSLWGPPSNGPYWAFEFDGVDVGSYTLVVQGGTDTAEALVDVL